MRRFLFVWLGAMAVAVTAQANPGATVYVTDTLEITLRTGPSLEHRVIRMLYSGQALEVLETSEGWMRVRVASQRHGTAEGWVLSRYVVNRLPWESQAKSLLEENAVLREKLPKTEKELTGALEREKGLALELKKRTEALSRIEGQYESLKSGASEYLELKEKAEHTETALKESESRSGQLSKENEKLRSSERNRWFLSGALVLVAGLFMGMLLGRQQKKRKSVYY